MPYSRDLAGACAVLALVATLALGAAQSSVALGQLMRGALQTARDPGQSFSAFGGQALDMLWMLLAWPLGMALAAAVLAGLAQVGPLFRWPLAAPAAAGSALRAPWSVESLTELSLLVCKFAVIGLALWFCVRSSLRGVFALPFGDLERALRPLGQLVLRAAVVAALAWFAFGALDLLIAHVRHRRGLRMTEREWRQDLRESYGDPELRARRAAALARARLALSLAELGRAELLVLDGRGRALALGRRSRDDAATPAVLAHAAGLDAERMRQRALQLGLRAVIDPPLLAALARLELTESIAPEHYRRVAQHMV